MKNLSERQVEIVRQLIISSKAFELAVLTKEEVRTEYQKEVLAVLNLLEKNA